MVKYAVAVASRATTRASGIVVPCKTGRPRPVSWSQRPMLLPGFEAWQPRLMTCVKVESRQLRESRAATLFFFGWNWRMFALSIAAATKSGSA